MKFHTSVRLLLAVTALVLYANAASAATFYVSPSGNDAANGQSEATAWKTVSKVNATTFAAGDIIRFQRGGEWREALNASTSGAVGNPITYDAYGPAASAKPKFWGSEVLLAANWVSEGGNVYRYDLSQAVTSVLANHGTGAGGQWFNNQTGNPVQSFPGAFTWSGNALRINSASDPRSDGRAYTAVVRDNLVFSNGKNNLVFRNLQADESADPADGYCFRVMGSENVLIEDCDAYRAARPTSVRSIPRASWVGAFTAPTPCRRTIAPPSMSPSATVRARAIRLSGSTALANTSRTVRIATTR